VIKIAAQQPFFIPDYFYFNKIYQSDIFIIADFLKFRKQSAMVRTRFQAINPPQYLTVPVEHPPKDPQPPLYQMKLNTEENWRRKHLRTLGSMFARYPFFEHYFPFVEEIYQSKTDFLADFCIDLLRLQLQLLMPDKKIVIASKVDVYNLESLKSWLNTLNEYCFLIDPAEKLFYQKHFDGLEQLNVTVSSSVEFPETYHPIMSLLVLLFLKGPETALYFKT
jgi:hypothetical protein